MIRRVVVSPPEGQAGTQAMSPRRRGGAAGLAPSPLVRMPSGRAGPPYSSFARRSERSRTTVSRVRSCFSTCASFLPVSFSRRRRLAR
jgi:hypothetical protein